MISSPSSETAAVGVVRWPSPTVVPGSATIIPASFNPMKAMNSPIPPPTAANSDRGSELMMTLRTPTAVRSANAQPERNTQPKAVCQGIPMCLTTV